MPATTMTRTLLLLATLLFSLSAHAIDIQTWTTPAGTRVHFVETHALPIIDVQIDFAAGSAFDPPGKSGLAALTRGNLDQGAGEWDENSLSERMADLGALLAGGADTDRASVSLRTLSTADKREPALAILRAVLNQPRFEAAIFERERSRTVASLKDSLTRPDSLAGRAFWAALYPDHPYGKQATPESVAAIQREDLLNFYRLHYVAANASITLVGDLSRAEAEAVVDKLVAELPAGQPAALPAAPKLPKGGQQNIAHPAAQAHIYLGVPAIPRGHPDYFPLLVGNYSLGGGGFVSRLMQEVRDKRGYAYSVYSYFAPLRQTGPFQIGLQTKRAQARDALKLTRSILEAFLRDGPSEQELEAAKANLSGSFPLRIDSNKKILDNVAAIGFYQLPLDYLDRYQARIAAVTAADVRRAFAAHVSTRHLVTVTVAAE